MANSQQAKKRARQAEKHRQHNVGMRSMLRTYQKTLVAAIAENRKDDLAGLYSRLTQLLDKHARKGLVHSNKAARLKSRYSKKLKDIGIKVGAVVAKPAQKPTAAKSKAAEKKPAATKTPAEVKKA